MKPSGSLAFAYARARAWKSRLLTREQFVALLALTDTERIQRSVDPPFEKLLKIYQLFSGIPIVRALLRLHEVENLKLLWRSVVRHRHFNRALWIELGGLATIPDAAIRATSPRQLAEALTKTPYGAIANEAARAFGDDLQATEAAIDRWASKQLADEARRLPATARQLIEVVIKERTDRSVCATTRNLLCRRAFRGDPFSIGPVVALILMAEAEVRQVRGLIERAGDASMDEALERVA